MLIKLKYIGSRFVQIARPFVPNFFYLFLAALKSWILSPYWHRVSELEIESAGISDQSVPYIKIKNGLSFYGFKPSKRDRLIYKIFLKSKIKRSIPEDCILVAYDILCYYKGPLDKRKRIAKGKFFDFKKGDLVVEIGTYNGFYMMRASELVGKTGKVIAIEATNENKNFCEMNARLNNLNNVSVVEKAVWSSKGELKFYRKSGAVGGAFTTALDDNVESFSVSCDKLDNILQDLNITKIDFIRIQINGAELEALYGMEKILRSKPKLLIATRYVRNDGKNIVKEVTTLLAKYNYENIIVEGDHTFAF